YRVLMLLVLARSWFLLGFSFRFTFRSSFGFRFRLISRFRLEWRFGLAFGAFLDAHQLVTPESLESRGPLVKRANRFGICAIEFLPAVAPHVDEADIAEDAEVFRDGRLLQAERGDDLGHGPFLEGEEGKDVAA